MTKEEFVAQLAQAGKITKTQADGIFSTFVEIVAASLKEGERVTLRGLGGLLGRAEEGTDGQEPRHRRGTQDTGAQGGEVLRLQRPEAAPQQNEEEVASGKGPFKLSRKAPCRNNRRVTEKGVLVMLLPMGR